MKRLLIILFLLLLCTSATAGGGMLQDIVAGGGAPPITYLLNCFSGTTADQSYTDGQVIDTSAEGCTAGSLTVAKASTAGALCSANKFTENAGLTEDTNYLCGTEITRSLGTALIYTGNINTALSYWKHGLTTTCTAGNTVQPEIGYTCTDTVCTTGADIKWAFVIGSHDSGGAAYTSGSTSGFTYGSLTFQNSSGTWNLINIENTSSTATLYAAPISYLYRYQVTLSSILVPNYSFVFVPTHFSSFTGTTGTSIASATYTPEIGNGFTIIEGAATIQTNKAGISLTHGTDNTIITNTGLTQFHVYGNIVTNGSSLIGTVIRSNSTGTNGYYCLVKSTADNYIYERSDATTFTQRVYDGTHGGATGNMSFYDNGDSINCKYISTSSVNMSYTTSTYSGNTYAGIYDKTSSGDNYPVTVDNFTVRPATGYSQFSIVGQ